MKTYTVTYERDSETWWIATVKGVQGVHTQGRSIDEARRRIREALSLAIGDRAGAKAKLVDDIRLPVEVKKMLATLKKARTREEAARVAARKAATTAARALTGKLGIGRRDAAALTGYSFQRIQQIVSG